MTNLHKEVESLCKNAKASISELSRLSGDLRNKILNEVAEEFRNQATQIIISNKKDLEYARNKGVSDAMLDRLELTDSRVRAIASSIENIALLSDVLGKNLYEFVREDGLKIRRVSIPLGVIFMIYESRPNVTADAWALSFKSGNVVILRPGSESFHSAKIMVDIIHKVLKQHDLSFHTCQLVPDSSYELVDIVLQQENDIDVVIPRGGKGLIKSIMKKTNIPVFRHLDGNCHIYIDKDADIDKARDVLFNAKMRRVSICGATESVLIHQDIINYLPKIISPLLENDCICVGDRQLQEICAEIEDITESDLYEEYLEAKLSIKIVKDVNEAVAHINHYGSHHTDAIISENEEVITCFLEEVDSAVLMVNASTQFSDGGEFGMGAEIGISTGKLHARGPVGIEQLTTYKYYVLGNGHIRS